MKYSAYAAHGVEASLPRPACGKEAFGQKVLAQPNREDAAQNAQSATTAPLPSAACGRPASSSVLKIIAAREGVIVIALTAEMIVETAIVTANCRKEVPRNTAQKAAGNEHGAQAQV